MNKSNRTKRILALHLLNNFSGSPKVFSFSLNALIEGGAKVDLITSGGPGFLNGLKLNYHTIRYRWHPNKWRRLVEFMFAQWIIFWKVIRLAPNSDVIYINTLLPGAGALAAKLMGKKVIYHMHETHVGNQGLDQVLKDIFFRTASKALFVSKFLKEAYPSLPQITAPVVPNGIEVAKPEVVSLDAKPHDVLMVSSLKKEKGLFEFLELARMLEDYNFLLILGTSQVAIDSFFEGKMIPSNLMILPAQPYVDPFYQKSKILLNLSDPHLLPESFGMTTLEGLKYGLPCIVPPVGGPAEIIQDGVQGFLVSNKNLRLIASHISRLLQDKESYSLMSLSAMERVQSFSLVKFKKNICNKILLLD